MKKYILLFVFALIYYASNAQIFDHIISADEDWYNDPVITGNILIQPGATLTIHPNVTVTMPTGSFILVNINAKLTANYVTFEAENSSYWLGISCRGTNSVYSVASYYEKTLPQPQVEIRNSTLSGMSAGIYSNSQFYNLPQESLNTTGGGILKIINSTFQDNPNTLALITYYNNLRLINQNPVSDVGYVTNCTFNDINFTGIYVHHSVNVGVTGCSFNGNSNSYPFCGVYVDQASAKINAAITQNPYTETPCTFDNLFYGVWINGLLTLPQSSMVRKALFTNCTYNITVLNSNNTRIFSNNINLNPAVSLSGIYLEGCTGFHVEENEIYRETSSQATDVTFGIVVKNSGINFNQIYRNTLENCYYGITALDANRNNGNGIGEESGLKFICNDFNSFDEAYYMVALTQYPTDPHHGVSCLQAGGIDNEEISPCYNAMVDRALAPTAENDFYNQHGDPNVMDILYIIPGYNNNPGVYDLNYHSTNVQPMYHPLYSTTTPHCDSKLPCFGPLCPVLPALPINDVFTDLAAAKSQLQATINGGDHDGLMYQVENVDANSLIYVYYLLMNNTPSHDILSVACENEIFPNYMIRDILVSNSYGIKCQAVRDALDNRNDTLTAYHLSQVYTAAQSFSTVENLMFEIAEMEQAYYFLINAGLNNYLERDEIEMDSVISYLDVMDDFYATVSLVLIALQEGDLGYADELVDQLDEMEVITGELASFEILYEDVLYPVYNDLDGAFWLMDEIYEEALLQVESYNTYSGAMAKSILITWFGYSYEPSFLTVPNYHKKTNPQQLKHDPENKQWLYPNPANDNITINNEELIASYVTIYDLQGRIIADHTLNSHKKTIDVQGLPKGMYIVQIKNQQEVISTTKLIKY